MARTTGKQYREEYENLLIKQQALKARISARLLQLSKLHPEAVIAEHEHTKIKAKSIANANYIASIEIDTQLAYIEAIEQWLAN